MQTWVHPGAAGARDWLSLGCSWLSVQSLGRVSLSQGQPFAEGFAKQEL